MSTEPCVYFNSPSGCWYGDHCRYSHIKGVAPRCRFYSGPGTCRNGNQCYFKHVEPDCAKKIVNAVVKSEVDKDLEDALQTLSLNSGDLKSGKIQKKVEKADTRGNSSPGGDTRQVICKEKYLSVKIDIPGLKQEENEEFCDNTPVTSFESGGNSDEPKTKGENKKTDESGLIKCGECGKLIHMKVLPKIPKDIQSTASDKENDTCCDEEDEDNVLDVSGGSDFTHEYDELEQHYRDMLLSMNKEHLNFLQQDPRFHQETFCGVCGRVFGKARHLLQHIMDKVKSENDEEDHKELLHELVLAFATRDIGLDDDKECMETLLLHLVASYTGGSDSSSDSNHGGLDRFLRMLAFRKHFCDSDDSDYISNPWGYDEDDMFELACQGIKPWDPEAGMALAVLNGDIDF
ncbi:uncharacterized protein LOC133190110 [Saccostrea echinata]|uniref:uncharacterized protein LOC133190110 n=1 Tax=Saccostrea echinata TaxID=191078 RepID=UPI002A7F1289|nr:uncharacterized protein LOC133190110 [Saccostrea echinata]